MSFMNDQITAKNFKDFYRKVLPYLKGTDHRLTYSELLDLSSNIYPYNTQRGSVLYDRSGRASIIGSSTVHTSQNGAQLYEQLITGTTPSTPNGYVSTGLLEGAIEPANVLLCSIFVDSGEFTKNVVDFAAISNDGGTIAFSFPVDSAYLNKPFIAKVRFVDKNKAIDVYGAFWDGSSNPAWTRTDKAVGFPDPNPYYANMTDTPSSPFDNISPWKDLRIVEDANAGTLVEIPKFYYKWTRDGASMKLQISDAPFMGSYVSPAHADRGDGVGERDYVYVGRYHCYTNYKSVSMVMPASGVTKGIARNGITNLGTDIWQYDYAMWWTIRLLYLVEFAHWDAQEKIGYGCGNGSGKQLTGASDTLPYHTGTYRATRQTYGTGVHYRYIEGLWENIYNWIDGINFSDDLIYCIKKPIDFPYPERGAIVGTRPKVSEGYITGWTNPTVQGFEYALYPSSVDNTLDSTQYVCDTALYGSSGIMVCGGSYYATGKTYGAFYLNGDVATGDNKPSRGCRLMVLPPSRLS